MTDMFSSLLRTGKPWQVAKPSGAVEKQVQRFTISTRVNQLSLSNVVGGG
jgi:hypothetical protein